MNLPKIALVFFCISTILLIGVFYLSINVNYQKEYFEEGHSNFTKEDSNILRVNGVRNGIASVTVVGDSSLIKDSATEMLMSGESISFDNKYSFYFGSIDLVEVKEHSVVLKINIKSSSFYYWLHIITTLLISFMITLVTALFVPMSFKSK